MRCMLLLMWALAASACSSRAPELPKRYLAAQNLVAPEKALWTGGAGDMAHYHADLLRDHAPSHMCRSGRPPTLALRWQKQERISEDYFCFFHQRCTLSLHWAGEWVAVFASRWDPRATPSLFNSVRPAIQAPHSTPRFRFALTGPLLVHATFTPLGLASGCYTYERTLFLRHCFHCWFFAMSNLTVRGLPDGLVGVSLHRTLDDILPV